MAITQIPHVPPILEVEDSLPIFTSTLRPLLDPIDPHPLAAASILQSQSTEEHMSRTDLRVPEANLEGDKEEGKDNNQEVDGGLQEHVQKLGPDGPPRAIDDHTQFWTTYDRISDLHDKELLDAWNKSLDVLLIFAGLFSAINTAFIMESYRGLQPDPAETTNALLRLSIAHRNDNITLSLEDLIPLTPSTVAINSIFFSSLSFSLTAAFGAVTAKQWLTEYASVGIMKALHVQGKRRQKKYNGLKTWHFRLIIELLPMLLQISLLLFLIGVVHFLWTIDKAVAVGQLVLSAAGLAIYIVTIVIGIIIPTSPFQTPLSRHLPRFFLRVRRGFNASIQSHRPLPWTHLNLSSLMTSLINKIGATSCITYLRAFFGPRASMIIQWIKNTYSKDRSALGEEQIDVIQWSQDEIVAAEAIVWLLEQAEHPDVTLTALDAVPRLPPDLMLSLVEQREGLLERLVRFHNSLIPPRPSLHEGNEWMITWPNRVMVSGVGLYHILKSQRFECRDFTLDPLIQSVERRDFPSIFASQQNQDVNLLHFLVDINLCSSESLQSNHPSVLHLLIALSRPLGYPYIIQIESMDVRQGLTGHSAIAIIQRPELILDFILRIAWTKTPFSKPLVYKPYPASVGDMILRPLFGLLEEELSRNVISHLAITFAVVCWSCKSDNPWSYLSEADQRTLELLLMDRCLAVDKSKHLLENIMLALSMIDVADFTNTFFRRDFSPHILRSLLKIAEPLLKAEIVAHWEKLPYPNFAQSLIRLSRKIDPDIRATWDEIGYLLLDCPSGDWVLPTDDEYGRDIVRLVTSLVSDNDFYSAAVLVEKMAETSNDVQFLAIIESPEYIYPYHRSHPFNWLFTPINFITKTLGLDDHNSSRPSVLLETQISFSVAMLHDDRMIDPICDFLNRMVQEDSDLHWPAYFIAAGIVPNTRPNAEPPVLLKSIEPEHLREQVFKDQQKDAWCGEALLMLWRKGRRESVKGRLPSDWNDSLFFNHDAAGKIMTNYWQHIRMHAYMGIDWDLIKEYFSRSLNEAGDTSQRSEPINQILSELSDYSNDRPPPPRERNASLHQSLSSESRPSPTDSVADI